MPENTGAIQANDTRFKPGQSGNPAGKPKGAKSKLQEDFLRDVLTAWETRGPDAITGMINEKPADFVKMVAGLMPKDIQFNINDASEMTDDELAQRVRELAARLAPFLAIGTGEAEPGIGDTGCAQIASSVH